MIGKKIKFEMSDEDFEYLEKYYKGFDRNGIYEILEIRDASTGISSGPSIIKNVDTNERFSIDETYHLPEDNQPKVHWWCFVTFDSNEYEIV